MNVLGSLKKNKDDKIDLFIYMKSGNVINIKCTEFESSKLTGNNGNRTLSITNPDCMSWTIDVGEIEAIICKK